MKGFKLHLLSNMAIVGIHVSSQGCTDDLFKVFLVIIATLIISIYDGFANVDPSKFSISM